MDTMMMDDIRAHQKYRQHFSTSPSGWLQLKQRQMVRKAFLKMVECMFQLLINAIIAIIII